MPRAWRLPPRAGPARQLGRVVLGGAPVPGAHVACTGLAREAAFAERRRAAAARRGRGQPFTFALVGRFRASKGQAAAIRAFARVAARAPAVRLLLVGG